MLRTLCRTTLAATVALATLTILFLARSARADGWGSHTPEPACTDVASVDANALITEGRKPYGLLWHGAGCYTVVTIPPSPPRCDWKTSITEDRMLGKERRLLIATSRPASAMFGLFPTAVVSVFTCKSGRLKRALHMKYPSAVKGELASRDRLTLLARDWSGTGSAADREQRDVYRWNEAEGRYEFEGATIWPAPQATAGARPQYGARHAFDPGHVAQASCGGLSVLRASDLMAFVSAKLMYGGFATSERCVVASDYGNGNPGCDWEIKVKDDRIVAGDRRLIVALSIHITGSGAWDAVMVFGCKDGHVAMAFADESQSLSVDDVSASTLALTYQGDEHLIYKWNPARRGYEFIRGAVVPPRRASRWSASP